jgi:hypothetical protein
MIFFKEKFSWKSLKWEQKFRLMFWVELEKHFDLEIMFLKAFDWWIEGEGTFDEFIFFECFFLWDIEETWWLIKVLGSQHMSQWAKEWKKIQKSICDVENSFWSKI